MNRRAEPAETVAGPGGLMDAPQSLTDLAYARLEEMIVTLKLPPGMAVSEAALSKHVGIGRTPIREALQRLARENLVVILPRRGILVSEINVEKQLRLLQVRRELENLIARSAARRAAAQERQRFREIANALEACAASNDETTFMRVDREFNVLGIAAARNEFAEGAMSLMHALSRRFWYFHYKQVADMPLAAKLHADVARAIAAGDENAAGKASDNLMEYIEGFTRATLGYGV
ncbi:MAG: GntR family transcriptional regulator [Betaproteobacteria bacterium]|nr:GntR family transcriptional regulator [Betaproteobacteria bacterium]